MEIEKNYHFSGTILPERAQLSFQLPEMEFFQISLNYSGWARINVINNLVSVRIRTFNSWEIFDLRNVVRNLVANQLNILGYILGFAYDIDISRVICDQLDVDYVFGIDVPCIAGRGGSTVVDSLAVLLLRKTSGPQGILLNRSMRDLNAALKSSDDTAFNCYRAVESLRNHCALIAGLEVEDDDAAWSLFREKAKVEKSALMEIKAKADPERHGRVVSVTDSDRVSLLTATWDIVEAYFETLPDLAVELK